MSDRKSAGTICFTPKKLAEAIKRLRGVAAPLRAWGRLAALAWGPSGGRAKLLRMRATDNRHDH